MVNAMSIKTVMKTPCVLNILMQFKHPFVLGPARAIVKESDNNPLYHVLKRRLRVRVSCKEKHPYSFVKERFKKSIRSMR